MIKISIILTSYNHEKYIHEAIESVIQQTYSDWELIIWDDASTDASWEVISKYKDSRIQAFKNETNEGPTYGVNKAIFEIAQGQYIAIHHSDDVWELDKLEKQVAYLEAHPDVGAVFSNALAISEDGSPLADERHFYQTIFAQPNRTRHEWLNHFFFKGNALCHPSVLIRKSCYESCGEYKPYYAQLPDFDMWIRLCLQYEIHVLPEKLIKFRVRDNEVNTSGNRPEVRIRDSYELFQILDNYRNITKTEDFKKIFDCFDGVDISNQVDIDYYLAHFAIKEKNQQGAKLFGLNILKQLLANKESALLLNEKHNFFIHDFFKLSGKLDILSNERLRESEAILRAQEVKLQELAHDRYLHIVALQSAQNQLNIQKHANHLELNETYRQLDEMHHRLLDTYASTSWRLTRPIRFASRQLKRLSLVMKLLPSVIHHCGGLISTSLKLVSAYRCGGIPYVKQYFRDAILSIQVKQKLALIIHAFYLDVFEEIIQSVDVHIKNIVDIYITCEEKNEVPIRSILTQYDLTATIQLVSNHGRDILPFLKILPKVVESGASLIIKVHTKKSTHLLEGNIWSKKLRSALVNAASIRQALGMFQQNERLGIIGPAGNVLPMDVNWGANQDEVFSLARRLGVNTEDVDRLTFVAGSMFFARLVTFLPLLELKLSDEEFEIEEGQLDGTLAHAIERAFAISAYKQGYTVTATDQTITTKFGYK